MIIASNNKGKIEEIKKILSEYEIYSSTGTLISTGKMEEGTTQVTLPSISGIYFIRAHQGKEASSHKVLLY